VLALYLYVAHCPAGLYVNTKGLYLYQQVMDPQVESTAIKLLATQGLENYREFLKLCHI